MHETSEPLSAAEYLKLGTINYVTYVHNTRAPYDYQKRKALPQHRFNVTEMMYVWNKLILILF